MNVSQLKTPSLIAAVGLLLGLTGDLLFYGKPMGISFPVLMAATLIALVGLAIVERVDARWVNLWLGVPLLFLATMSAVRAAPLLRLLNIGGALLLLALLADSLATRLLTALNIGGYLTALIRTAATTIISTPLLLKRSVTEARAREDGTLPARSVLTGLLIAAPFLLIFTALFASADLLFSRYLEDILGDFTLGDLVGHSLLSAALAWVAVGGLAYALSRAAEVDASKQQPAVWGVLETTEASITLFSIDALFLVFVSIQFAALFGGEAFLERQGLTYSEYARRGFFELLAVALITLALILALDFVTRRETRRQRLSFLLGSGLMIAMTIVILVSAFQRLRLYELAFGFTRLRLHTHVFMVWLAGLLAFLLLALFIRRTRLFATGALIAALGFTVTLNVLDPDAFIVAHNLQRYRQGEELDVEYLGSLSADAVPRLMPLLSSYGPEIRDEVGPWLRLHLNRLDRRQERAGWPSAHTAINRAYRALDANREIIESYEPAYWSAWD